MCSVVLLIKDQDLFAFEHTSGRRSVSSSIGGRDKIHDELRYTIEADEMAIESTAVRSPFYGSIEPGERRKPTSPPVDAPSSPDYHTDDMDVDAVIGKGAKAWDDHIKQAGSVDAISEQLAAREEQRTHAGHNQALSFNSQQPPAWDDHVKQLDYKDAAVERLANRGEDRAHAGYNQEVTLKSRPPGLDIYTPQVQNTSA
jgi:hypothetical protein